MIEFPLHREVTDYQDKLVGQFTGRSILGLAAGGALVVGVGLLITLAEVPPAVGSWLLVLTAPVFYFGLARPDTGVTPERYLLQVIEHYLKDNSYTYRSESEYLYMAKEGEDEDVVPKKTARRERRRKEQ